MLYGTDEEFAYQSARANEERDLSDECQDAVVSLVHEELAEMHQKRSELVSALRSVRQRKLNYRIIGCVKES
jgi:crotonobetainyl-CoA:carnitine CoA-transferase CaiB-like acyl-CoA transferase